MGIDGAKPDANASRVKPVRYDRAPQDKLETGQAKVNHGKRKRIVEPIFGSVKNVPSCLRSHLGGIEKINNAWLLVALADDCKRLHKLMAA